MQGTGTKVFITDNEVQWEPTAPGMKRKIMAWDDRLMLVRVEFETGGIGALHKHPHTQITHVERGAFEVELTCKTYYFNTFSFTISILVSPTFRISNS